MPKRNRKPNKEKTMRRIRLDYLLIVISFILAGSATAQERYHAFIKGVVVDEKGRPVPRAVIIFDNSETRTSKCWIADNLDTNRVIADGAGQFFYNEYCDTENRTIVLFTEAATGYDSAQTPIHAPFWPELRRNNARFAGLAVKLQGNQNIDLGTIPIQVWYSRVELFVTDKKGRPYYKSDDDWSTYALIVRDERGDAVGSDGLSISDIRNNIRIDRGSVMLALPDGKWTLELLKDLDDFDQTGKTLRYLAKTTITVKKTDVCAQARLVVK